MKVEVDKVIQKKSPSLYRALPRFVIAFVERIIKQKQINEALDYCHGKQGQEFLTSVLDFMQIQRHFDGIEQLDSSKSYIFASNHPLGGLDGLVLLEGLHTPHKGVKVVVNDLLAAIEPLSESFILVDKFGRQTSARLKALNDDIASGVDVIFFPAGLCSRRLDGEIKDKMWQKSFVTKAIEYKRDIVPLYVENRNSNTFYNLANLRTRLGIKANLEMILLPREMFRKQNRNIRIVVGEPIPYSELQSGGSAHEWCAKIRKLCYELKGMSID